MKRMARADVPVRDAYKLYMLMKKLEPAYDFEIDREKTIIVKHGGKIRSDGTISFSQRSSAEEFQREISELKNMEAEIEYEQVTLDLAEMSDCKLSLEDIAALDGFIEFR